MIWADGMKTVGGVSVIWGDRSPWSDPATAGFSVIWADKSVKADSVIWGDGTVSAASAIAGRGEK